MGSTRRTRQYQEEQRWINYLRSRTRANHLNNEEQR